MRLPPVGPSARGKSWRRRRCCLRGSLRGGLCLPDNLHVHGLGEDLCPQLRRMEGASPRGRPVGGQADPQDEGLNSALFPHRDHGERPLLANEPADAPRLPEELAEAGVEPVQQRHVGLRPVARWPAVVGGAGHHDTGQRLRELDRGLRNFALDRSREPLHVRALDLLLSRSIRQLTPSLGIIQWERVEQSHQVLGALLFSVLLLVP
mmetsp:Transcript_141606/g.353057  ORF Transcript_141606/g.353057 Transcript_141606/m.353057 type:complete len:207 (-) Transcript_141606:533-1153(-)